MTSWIFVFLLSVFAQEISPQDSVASPSDFEAAVAEIKVNLYSMRNPDIPKAGSDGVAPALLLIPALEATIEMGLVILNRALIQKIIGAATGTAIARKLWKLREDFYNNEENREQIVQQVNETFQQAKQMGELKSVICPDCQTQSYDSGYEVGTRVANQASDELSCVSCKSATPGLAYSATAYKGNTQSQTRNEDPSRQKLMSCRNSSIEGCCQNFLERFAPRGKKYLIRSGNGFAVFKKGDPSKKRDCCLEWDMQNGHFEIFDNKGNHLGAKECDDLSPDSLCERFQGAGHWLPNSNSHKPRTAACSK